MDAFFDRPGLSLGRLRSFLAVADAGGIGLAAPRNPTRQNQLHRQIGELEGFFAVALVERRGRSVVLTAAGEKLARVARELLARLRDLASVPEPSPQVALGAGDSVLESWIIPNLRAFGGARLRLSTRSSPAVVEGLFDSELDFGIVRATDLRPGLRSRPLGVVEYALYVPKALKPKASVGVKRLLETVPVGVVTGEPSFRARLDAALQRADVSFRPAYVCTTFSELRAAVAEGMCAAVLPTLARAKLPRAAFSELRDPILGKHDGRMSLAWTPRLERQRPRVAALVPGIVAGLRR